MKTGEQRKASRRVRNRQANGSTMVEFSAGSILLFSVGVPLLIFFANMCAQLILQSEVSHIANQAAQVCDDGKYWLGMPRPGYTEQVASDKATNAAQVLCQQVGLSGASVKVSFDNSNPDFDLTICEVNVNALAKIPFRTTVFGFDMAQLFPGNIKAQGVAAHAKVQPYALIHMDAPTAEDQVYTRPLGLNRRDVAVIPAYGFFNMMVAGQGQPTPYGKGIAPLQPENFFAMNHYHLKKTDVDYVNATGTEIPLSGWHPGRVINGQQVTFR